MISKSFLILGLLFAAAVLISSTQAALDEQNLAAAGEETNQGGYGSRRCPYGCCRYSGYQCVYCCRSAEEANQVNKQTDKEPNPANENGNGGWRGHGGGGHGSGWGGRGGGRRCCGKDNKNKASTAENLSKAEEQESMNNVNYYGGGGGHGWRGGGGGRRCCGKEKDGETKPKN